MSNWNTIKNDKSYVPPANLLASAWKEVYDNWEPCHTNDWKMDHVGWCYSFFDTNEFNFCCGPAYANTLNDSVGIYEELEKLFADVGVGIFELVEIGASENCHQFNLNRFQNIPGFPTDEEDVKKELIEFLKIRMDLLGARHHSDWDKLDEI